MPQPLRRRCRGLWQGTPVAPACYPCRLEICPEPRMRAFRLPHALLHAVLLALMLPAGATLADPSATTSAIPDLEQIMADPDWIGPAVESPYWALDGRSVLFQLKREGSPLRDRFRIDLGSGEQTPVA